MVTKIARLVEENGVAKEVDVKFVDFKKVKSNDPIAFYFGQMAAMAKTKLPKKNSEDYKELAPEYIRGYHSAMKE